MTSAFGWLDHSEQQRRRMLEIVDQFRDKGVLDELGFGVIRDAFSDRFFPGISTIQTRARYLLFVPWVYRRIEREEVAVAQIDARARKYQAEIARSLLRGDETDLLGVIGGQVGEGLVRLPSDIYWNGLRRYRIWRFSGSVSQYFRTNERTRQPLWSDDGELVEQVLVRDWDPGLPPEPPGLFTATSFALSREEAEYLRERIVAEVAGTMLALCLDADRRLDPIEVPWLHPDLPAFPSRVRSDLDHAHRFAIVAWGGVLLYNLMLAEAAEQALLPIAKGRVEQYRNDLAQYAATVEDQGLLLRQWKMADFWETVVGDGHQVRHATRAFVGSLAEWIVDDPRGIADNVDARRAIRERELMLKGGLAKLTHRKALEGFGGSAGLYPQTYRWPNVKRIVGDIQRGLRQRRTETGDA